MSARFRGVLVGIVATAMVLAVASSNAFSSSPRLTGSWSGSMTPGSGSTAQRHRLRIVVNASERGGSWRISARCQGPLRLKNISNGYHHYVEEVAPGATCLGGGIDCLKRVGGGLYDTFSSRPGTDADSDGTLHRSAD